MLDTTNINNDENRSQSTQNQAPKFKLEENILAAMIVVSVLSGVVGGVIGAYFFGAGEGTATFNNGSLERTIVVNEESAVIDVVEKSRPAIVSIVGTRQVASGSPNSLFLPFPFDIFYDIPNSPTQEMEVSAGTGFFVSSDGLVATNKHVISDQAANYKVLTNDGKQYDAQIVAQDPVNDIALLKVEGSGFPTLQLGDSDKIKVGQRVVAIGNALGQFTNTVTTGVISGINRSIVATGQLSAPSQIEGAIQTDAAINPGNSGGPLLDLSGAVVGINTAISAEGQLLGFAIPVNDLKADLKIYRERGRIVKPFIGVRYIMITPALQEERGLSVSQGALVTVGENNEPAVIPGSPAERAGLREGDIILKLNDKDINLENSLASAVRNLEPGDIIELSVWRDNREIKVNLTLGERNS